MDERSMQYAQGLSTLIQKETISWHKQTDKTKFYEFHDLLRQTFPKVFATCEVEDFDGSLLIKWQGKSSERPVMFMNHHDVVEAPGEWKYPPFSGTIAEDKIWGRGTLDTKGGLYCMLQAAEELMEQGFVPAQDLYFETSCTEEASGTGCNRMTKELKKRGIHFHMALDEGGMIVYDPVGGADGYFAMIGVGEKAYADVKFIARSNGGHASTPGKDTPLVRLGKFMSAVERSNIFQIQMNEVVAEMLRRMGPTMKPPLNRLLADPTKIKRALNMILPRMSGAAGAMLKTTIAFTMAGGSDAANVIPQEAFVTANMRFSHHQGSKKSLIAVAKLARRYDIEVIVTDLGVESHISDFNSEPFHLMEEAVSAIFPDVISAPYVTNTASDCRYMSRICDNCLRLTPFVITDEQMESIHGLDENVDVSCLAPAVDFYKYLMEHSS